MEWKRSCVSFSVQSDGSRFAAYPDAEELVRQALAAWQDVTCGGPEGGHPSILLNDAFGPVACKEQEYNTGQGNANIILFHDTSWPYKDPGALALTTVTFDVTTGEIFDADLEVNSTATLSLDTPVLPGHFDLLSILTHESGHFLGLAHSREPGSVMRATYAPGTDDLRNLGADDVSGICTIYPPEKPMTACDFTPRYGFSADCSMAANAGRGCSLAPHAPGSGRGSGGAPIAVSLAVGLAVALGRRKSGRHPEPG